VAKKETAVESAEAEPALGAVLENEHVRRWGPAVGLALLAFFFLWPSLHGVYIWDDDQWLVANPWVQSWGGLKQIWLSPSSNAQYYPLVFTMFWAEHKLWGLDGVAYHAVNLLLHVTTALLIFSLLKKLKLPGGTLGAWLAATIFAIHPVNVESVAWVAERKNVLCGIFFFAAMLYALKFFGVIDAKEGDGAAERPCWKRYTAAIVLFLLAMLSKTTACVLPPAILLMIWWRRGKMTRREILLVVPFFLIAAGLGSITTWTEHGPTGTTGAEWIYSPLARAVAEHPAAATTGMRLEAMGQEFVARTLIAGQAVWFYVGKIFWPYPVVQVYPRFSFDVTSPALYIAPVGLLAVLGILFALRKRITRGPLTAALFFVGALFPALGYINFYTMLYTFVADHYQYLACIGVIVLGVETLLWALRKASATVPTDLATVDEGAVRFFRLTSGLVSGGLILALGIQTRGVSDLYTNGEALWKFNTDTNPAAFAAWNNLATAIIRRQVTTAAEVEQQRVDAIDALQHSIVAAPWDWRAYHTLGMIYLETNDPVNAAKYLDAGEARMPAFVRNGRANFFEQQAALNAQPLAGAAGGLDADSTDATYSPNFLLGRNYEDHGQWDAAIACFTNDLQAFPQNAESYFHIGNCAVGKGDFAAAVQWYTRAIDKRPAYAEAYFNRGICRRSLGQEQEGVADLLKSRSLDPTVVRKVPGLLLEEAKKFRTDPTPESK
jgi:tetratricopeptide (TPR) repeat protein